jgi:hypothetical protein
MTEASIGRMTAKSVPSTSGRTTPACWPRTTRCLIGHRVVDSRRLLGHRDGAVEGLLEVRPRELVLVGEVAVGGGDVHAGVLGDVIEGGVNTLGGEDLFGGIDEPLPVARGFGAQPARLGRGSRFHWGPPGRGVIVDIFTVARAQAASSFIPGARPRSPRSVGQNQNPARTSLSWLTLTLPVRLRTPITMIVCTNGRYATLITRNHDCGSICLD